GPMVLQSCQRVLHNWHDADDGFQATLVVVARRAASHTWNESVGTWLYRVAHRLALNIRKVKIGLAAVLAVCIAGAGAGLALQGMPTTTPVEKRPSQPERSPNQEIGRPLQNARQPVLDCYGDPLPPGALV